ncbi:type IV pilin protein [Psychrobacter sanguinis]|uniref:Prepilin-type N-terminal cleavage/methylation domain-containing protein n=1 Tax=Psychrobacter sanguinis TaxID=861445 RepID=A0A844M2A7_9GAMM|nr:prepilin-type N-terminal cleavage/methylation domain-containing protein [Psychrobacter sanguinis]MUG32943.1 prepilin-type N-terminal cleavage/methylation domain-containing protein [Psychrobacter sanguinis]
MSSQQGFTLIELMIVVAIIGVLSLIAIPSYQSYAQKTSEAACLSQTKAFSNQIFLERNDPTNEFDVDKATRILNTASDKTACETMVYNDGTSVTPAVMPSVQSKIKNPGSDHTHIICNLDKSVQCEASNL